LITRRAARFDPQDLPSTIAATVSSMPSASLAQC